MSLILNELFDPFLSMINRCPVLNTPIDWKETPAAHIFIADLPGLKKEQVEVEVMEDGNGRLLQISGDRVDATANDENDESSGHKWRHVERCRGKFCRRFRLPENVKAGEVRAAMENGILTVTVPKEEVKKPEKKVIEIETV
ncbi:class I heat shock protein-like [Benincasa hispida]|uniref:class I heat shock protein-like n=1 Tax=Benincasa hispida TaxID=102211 RepID=UPI0019015D48|nr:class I heat shock protein-like [Benincasa hispida]